MKKLISIIIMIVVILSLGACGKKSQADVIKSLGEKVQKIDKFEVDAVMKIKELNKEHIFDVNVKYQAPDNYKVTLINKDSNNVQVVLKNKDGVFVLTPALNKSFKFQSDWPLNSSQPYLFQSLVKDIMNDEELIYFKDNGNYVFETKVDYRRSRDLTSQKIIIDASSLFPKEIIVYDSQKEPKITVLFNEVDIKPKFAENEFTVEHSMSTTINYYKETLPTFDIREIMYPTFLDSGTTLSQEKLTNDGTRAIMTFQGTSTFTLIEEFVNIENNMDLDIVYGDPIIIRTGVAFLTDTSITWHENGIEFLVISDNMDADELYKVANSFMTASKK